MHNMVVGNLIVKIFIAIFAFELEVKSFYYQWL